MNNVRNKIHFQLAFISVSVFLTAIPFCAVGQNSISASFPEIKHSYLLATTHALGRLNEEEKFSTNVVYQNYLNLLKDINLIDISGFVRLRSHHQIGVLASSFKEGPYISKTNLALSYAYGIKVVRTSSLSAGVQAGFKRIGIDGASTGVAGSATAPDLGINLVFRHPSFFLFYSANQLIATKIRPSAVYLKLKRFHEIRVGLQIKLGRKSSLQPQVHILLYEQLPWSYGAIVHLHLLSVLSVGVGSYNASTVIVQTAIHIPESSGWKFSILGSYRQLTGNLPGSLLSNSMEVGITVSKKNKQLVYEDNE